MFKGVDVIDIMVDSMETIEEAVWEKLNGRAEDYAADRAEEMADRDRYDD